MGKDWYPNCWQSQEWRLTHLYHILSKGKGIVRFKMNWAQTELYHGLHNRNNILKARQLGMSTFTSIFILDNCLFRQNFKAGIIDKGIDDAKEKLKKIKLAYQLLKEPPPDYADDPVTDADDREAIRKFGMGLVRTLEQDQKRVPQILDERAEFPNGSEIRIGTSLRGGTLDFLHVSEYGWVANNNPVRAQEIKSGGFESVPDSGCVVIESTHEGAKSGENYMILKAAMDNIGKPHSSQDFKFFFFPWFKQQEYRIESNMPLGDTQEDSYFVSLAKQGIILDDAQKRWYVAKSKTLGYRVKTEYPSTPEEAFMTQAEGAIYGKLIAHLRSEGRMAVEADADAYLPLYVSWDIGMKDSKAMWLIQPQSNGRFLALDYYAGSDKTLPHMLQVCQEWERKHGQLIHMHLLPHDASNRDLATGISFVMHFYKAGLPAAVVPKVRDVWQGIHEVKTLLPYFSFHERCSRAIIEGGVENISGVDALENYRKAPNGSNGVMRDMPLHDESSHGADAFRMFAEGLAAGFVSKNGVQRKSHKQSPLLGKATMKNKVRAMGVPNTW